MSNRSATLRQTSAVGAVEPYIDNLDVYLGREGNDLAKYRGNRNYRSKIKEQKDRYQRAKGHRLKNIIAQNVIKHFQEMGVTFHYKPDNNHGLWVVAPMKIVLKKVKQALREKGTKPRPPKLSKKRRERLNRRGTFLGPSSLLTSSQVKKQFLVTILNDGTRLVDGVSVAPSSAVASSTVLLTSQQDSEDHISSSFSTQSSVIAASESSYHSSVVARSTFSLSDNIHSNSFRPIDKSAVHMAQTTTASNQNSEIDDNEMVQLSVHLAEIQMMKSQKEDLGQEGQEYQRQGCQTSMPILNSPDLCEQLMKEEVGRLTPLLPNNLDDNKSPFLPNIEETNYSETEDFLHDSQILDGIFEEDIETCNSDNNCFNEEQEEHQNETCLRNSFQSMALSLGAQKRDLL